MTPWTELVMNTSLASSSRRMRSGVSLTARLSSWAIRSTAALVTPGSSLPPAGGVCRTPSITANTLARSVSSTSPPMSVIRSCSSAPGPASPAR